MESWFQEFLYNDVRVLLIGAALFIGLLVFVLLAFGLRSHRHGAQGQANRTRGGETAGQKGQSPSIDVCVESTGETIDGEPAVLAPAPTPAAAEEKPIHVEPESHNEFVQEFDGQEQGGDLLAEAKHCNDLADKAFAAADLAQAREYYIKGLSKASLVDAPAVQAVSRMMLGDISKIEGDLTTACEHWQLARDLYARCNEKGKSAEVEGRMRENQCPTDWVLNEF